ncbi:MAG: hypothetical protein R3D02_10610 [Hyphomicrobiales bacterium]
MYRASRSPPSWKPTDARGAVLLAVGTIDAAELLAGLRERLEDFRIPEIIEMRAHLPFTGRGKIDRKALAADFDSARMAIAGDEQ